MQRDGTGPEFGAGPIRTGDPQGSAHDHRRVPDGPGTGGTASDGQAPGFGPTWALLAASEPVQYAPVLGIMRPTLKARVPVPEALPAEAAAAGTGTAGTGTAGTGTAGTGTDPVAVGRPILRADEPLGYSPRPAGPGRPAAGRSVLLGVAAVLAVAAAGGYFALGMNREGGGPAITADAALSPDLSPVVGDAVAPRTPLAPVAPVAAAAAAPSPGVDTRPVLPVPVERPAGIAAESAAAVATGDSGAAPAPQDRRSMVRSAQRALADAGLDPGPADGLMGPKTRAAVIAYQRRVGIEADGEIDAALLQRLTAVERFSDDDIPPARLPAPAPVRATALPDSAPGSGRSARLGGIDGLISTFHRVFGAPDGAPVGREAIADAGGTDGVRR